jgi:hypothetical protein
MQERVKGLKEKVASKKKPTRTAEMFDALSDREVRGRLQHVVGKLRQTISPARRTKLEIKKSVLQRRLALLDAMNALPPTDRSSALSALRATKSKLTANAGAVESTRKMSERQKLKEIESIIGGKEQREVAKALDELTKIFKGPKMNLTEALEKAKTQVCAAAQDEALKSQKAPNPLPPSKAKSEPFEPFMTKEQEQRARMVALFEAVDPSKLAILGELVEKIKKREDGFDQMWKSYKQKWGAKAVEEAFTKVRGEKNKFYRAKMVALLTANRPNKLSEVDGLMAKHEGSYDQMFKRWVEAKIFNSQAVTAAHAKAMQQLKG